MLEQIDTELQSIQAKLRDGSGTGSDLGALLVTLLANIATTDTVADTLAAQVVTSDAVVDVLTSAMTTSKALMVSLAD